MATVLGRNNPNYGRGEYTLTDTRSPETSPALLYQRLLDAFRAPGYSPPRLPKIGMQLMQLSRQPEVDLNQVMKVLEKDPLLAAAVLRVARSPAFTGSQDILSLHQALMRLGLETMAEIVLQASMTMEMFRAPGYESAMEALSRHSTVVAHLTRYICSASDIPNDYAFVCGLMHDVGVVASLAILAHRRKKPPPLELVWPAVEQAHPEAGAIVARIWNLPNQVIGVIRYHHQMVHEGRVHRVAVAVALADALAIEAGFGHEAHEEPGDARAQIELAARHLKIDGPRLARLREQTHHLAQHIEF